MSEEIQYAEVLRPEKGIAQEMIGGDDPDFDLVQQKQVGSRRWSIDYEVIIKRKSDGKLFSCGFSHGATESQDEQPFDYSDPEFIECKEVEVVTKKYMDLPRKLEPVSAPIAKA